MALSQSTSITSLLIPSLRRNLVGESRNPITAILPTTETPKYPLISSVLTARSRPCSPLRTISCVASAGDISSENGTRESTSLFVKGLPDSVSEGRLRKVFSEFGQVSNGYGYVWFNRKEDAESAVEAMNGKLDPGSQEPGKNLKLSDETHPKVAMCC